ncbi:MAG: N-acetylmuramoyl-L-alanine amidase, partial [Clostridia bacterium]|nr:N-acetylmuramoyl-L-alanine amidase [Clostridia bacterium]
EVWVLKPTAVVENVRLKRQGESALLDVELRGEVTPRVFALASPARLVVDVPQAVLAVGALADVGGTLPVGPVTGLRTGRPASGVTRLVVDLAGPVAYTVDNGTSRLTVRIAPADGGLVVIDPGHGGRDVGARGPSGTFEKDVNLAIARALADRLREAGVAVMLTREADVEVDLYARPTLAARPGVLAFISVHANAANDSNVQGTETYHYPGSASGRALAESIQRQLVALGLPDRGVRAADFVVLRESPVPAALVEVAFLSNPEGERLLTSSAFQGQAAAAIARGVLAYLSAVAVRR